jgi:hypothetical protein
MIPWFHRETLDKSAVGFMLLLIVLLVIFRISPASHKHQQLQRLQGQMKIYGEDTNWYEIYQKWKEEKESKANYVKCLEENIYHEDELYRLVERWQRESRVFGVELIRYIPGAHGQDPEYLYKKVQMVLQGEYLPMLQYLQRMMRTTSFRNVRLVFNKSSLGLQCSLDFEVFMKAGKENGKGIKNTETE